MLYGDTRGLWTRDIEEVSRIMELDKRVDLVSLLTGRKPWHGPASSGQGAE